MIRRRTGVAVAALAVLGAAACVPEPPPPPGPVIPAFSGRYTTGLGNTSGETVAYGDGKMYVTNTAGGGSVDVVSLADPTNPSFVTRISMAPYGLPNSVAFKGGLVVVAAEAATKTDPGKVVVFDAAGAFLAEATVGALPDMVTITPDGTKALVANEAEPNTAYTVDPEGSVSVVDLTTAAAGGPLTVQTIGFADFNVGGPRASDLPAGVRIYGPGASVAQDLEPEYIAVDPAGATAWVTLQENNAIAKLDLATNTVTSIAALGLKDHSLAGNGLDPWDQDLAANIGTWPVKGMYQPDAIAVVVKDGTPYLVSANEGDARDYNPGLQEEIRVGAAGYVLDPTAFPNAATLKQNANLGRLTVTKKGGDTDGDGDYDEIHVLGARSFSVWDQDGGLVYDSGDQLEQTIKADRPLTFNVSNDGNTVDNRSDNKGPEPEGVAVGEIDGRPYAFIGLERDGGVAVVNMADPTAPVLERIVSTRDYALPAAPDSGPEVLTFVPAGAVSDRPVLLVANEVSGTVAVLAL